MSKQELYQQALDTWGEGSQYGMAQEECGELISAINRHFRGDADSDDVAAEVADVEIMCEQLRILIGDQRVEQHKTEKLDRLEDRLND